MNRPSRLLLSTLVVALGSTAPSRAQDLSWEEVAQTQEVVYLEEVAVGPGGEVISAMTAGSVVVEQDNGEEWVLDLEGLEDPDGNRYYVDGGAFQHDEDDPVTYRFRVVRYEPQMMSEQEVIDAWLDVNPDASDAELSAFLDDRAAASEPPDRPINIEPSIADWAETADVEELAEIVVLLREQPPLELPKAVNALLESEPVYWLEAMEQRLLAIEDRKTEIAGLQQDLIGDIEALGGVVLDAYWLYNGLVVEVTPEGVEALFADPRVLTIDWPTESGPAGYDHAGADAREATQTWLFDDYGYTGQHGRWGGPGSSHVYVLIADSWVDVDHPAWDDGSGQSRCLGSKMLHNGQWFNGSRMQDHPRDNHGNNVAAAVLADLRDGQDPGNPYLDSTERADISGLAAGAVFSFCEMKDSSMHSVQFTDVVELAVELNVDIIQSSTGSIHADWDEACRVDQMSDPALRAVNDARAENIFFVECAGNYGNGWDDQPCTVWNPGGASGAFTVGSLDRGTEDLDEAIVWNDEDCSGDRYDHDPPIECGSGRGGDVYGRPLIKTVTPAGRSGTPADYLKGLPLPQLVWPAWDSCELFYPGYHVYWPTKNQDCDPDPGGGSSHTSWAAPVATGAAADMLDFMITDPAMPYLATMIVGNLFSHMLLMGDGYREIDPPCPENTVCDGGSTQAAGTPLDQLTGSGRLRMRLFTEEGMDAPWAWGFAWAALDHGQTFYEPINESGGQNLPVDAEADWLRAAIWYHEPNMDDDPVVIPTSSIRLSIRADDGAPVYQCYSTAPQSQRLWLGNVVAGEAWSIRLQGLSIPASIDPSYFHDEQTRGVFIAYYWEDRARDGDSGEGPYASDDIY